MSAKNDTNEGRTTVAIQDETWQRLNARKRPGDSFNDVVDRLLEDTSESTDTEVSE